MTREEAINELTEELIGINPNALGREEIERWAVALNMAIEALKQERTHGEWIYKNGKYWCSSCGDRAIYHFHIQAPLPHLTNFCPNCGSDNRKRDC